MLVACIDIGSNTTRLLVAQRGDAVPLEEVHCERAFNAIVLDDHAIPEDKVRQIAAVVKTQARHARERGAMAVRVVATGLVRAASNSAEIAAALSGAAGADAEMLPAREEARLAFKGAIGVLVEPPPGSLAVVDVGGGSTEIAIGSGSGGVDWWRSIPIGSATLMTDLGGASFDRERMASLRRRAEQAFRPIHPPAVDWAWAVGGSAQSLHRIAGDELGVEALDHALDLLCTTPPGEVAERYELDPDRVALLPGGLTVLRWASGVIGRPLRIGRGGLREGVALELLEQLESPTGRV